MRRYRKSLTVGVKNKQTIPLCHVPYELTRRTYGEKKWWVVIVKDTKGCSRIPLCHAAHQLTSRTYGENKCGNVMVKDQ